MESSCWPESLPSSRIKAIQELTQGQHLTNKLREMLRRPEKIESDIDSVEDVVGQILGMFDNTLSILSSSSFNDAPNALIPTGDVRSPSSCDDQKSEDYGESIKSVAPLKVKRGCYKRRKDSWTSIKIASRLIDDGYAWRKYGQKVILNAKHQRNYYRCTHKTDQGCRATKQVQKTEDEPPKYKITYSGHHTCNNQLRSPLIIIDSPDHKDNNSFVLSFEKTGLNKNKQVDSCFPPTKQDLKDEDFPSLSFRQNQVSSSNHYQLPWDLSTQVSQVPSEPMSVMSSGLDHEDMISSYSSTCSTHGYEMDNLLGSNVFVDFPYELCS